MNIEILKKEIADHLRELEPESIILFGSHAYGSPSSDSDIDLYVVTKDDFIPGTYNEKRKIVRKISNALMDIRLKENLDLIVHTRPMSRKFYAMNSSFAQDIRKRGIRIL
jgi:predicted nucleotidyltransferase